MTSGLEDKIIAYFDGELSDADSAELLHLTSISPEIRDLFHEHEMLRELAREATRSVMVSPEVESSLFLRIEALAEQPVRQKAVLLVSRRSVIVAALALVLISGSLGYFVPKLFSNNSTAQLGTNVGNTSHSSALSDAALVAPIENSSKENSPRQAAASFISERSGMSTEVPRNVLPNKLTVNDRKINSSQSSPTVSNAEQIADIVLPKIKTVPVREDVIHSNLSEKLSPFDLEEMQPDSRSLFEASLQTSSGFTYPADAAPIKPFADQRLSVAYHITENNLIGFRLGSGLFQQLGSVMVQQEGGVEVLRRAIETKRSFSEEVFLSHLIPIFFVAPFTIEFAIDGGFIPGGYTVGAEAGVRIPVSEDFMLDVAFALSRIHSNALSSSDILASESAGMKPVILDGVDIHNTLNGRLHYGLIYRF